MKATPAPPALLQTHTNICAEETVQIQGFKNYGEEEEACVFPAAVSGANAVELSAVQLQSVEFWTRRSQVYVRGSLLELFPFSTFIVGPLNRTKRRTRYGRVPLTVGVWQSHTHTHRPDRYPNACPPPRPPPSPQPTHTMLCPSGREYELFFFGSFLHFIVAKMLKINSWTTLRPLIWISSYPDV